MNRNNLPSLVFGVFFLAILSLLGYMLFPFLSTIIFAFILAGAFLPLSNLLIKKWKIKRPWAASLVCLVIVLAILLPSLYLIIELSHQVMEFYQELKSKLTQETLQEIFFGDGYFARALKQFFQGLNVDYTYQTFQAVIIENAKEFSLNIFTALNALVGNIFSFLFNVLVMLLIIFALLSEGPRLKEFVLKLSPLPKKDEELIIHKFNQMNYVTLVCNGLGGLIQGLLAGLGFFLAGIGSSLLWGTIMVFLAFIPLVGISIVFIPATIYLLATGKIITAIILCVFCTVLSLVVENWFKPKFMGKQIKLDSLLILFSIICGMSAFGMAGIFYGPLVIIIFLTIVELYHQKYAPDETEYP